MRAIPFFILAILVTASGCGGRQTKRLKPQTVAILSEATKVEVFRLDPHDGPYSQKPKAENVVRVGGYRVIHKGTDQGKELAERLAGILFDDAAYNDDHAKCFDPGVAFRAWKGDESVDVIICYMCHNAYVGVPVEHADENVWFSRTRWSDLVRLAKDAFPNDADIQKLRE